MIEEVEFPRFRGRLTRGDISPLLVHAATTPPGSRPTSTFVVRAEARDARGALRSARAAITFVNPLWTASRGAITWLPVRSDPFAREAGEALPVPGGGSAERGGRHYRVPASIGDPGADGAVLEEVLLAGFSIAPNQPADLARLDAVGALASCDLGT
jgi:hypothetical protein